MYDSHSDPTFLNLLFTPAPDGRQLQRVFCITSRTSRTSEDLPDKNQIHRAHTLILPDRRDYTAATAQSRSPSGPPIADV